MLQVYTEQGHVLIGHMDKGQSYIYYLYYKNNHKYNAFMQQTQS